MTFCIAINSDIAVASCPLPRGQCYWQHQETNLCKYTEEELTVEAFCELTGKQLPTPDANQTLITKLKHALHKP